LKIAIVTDTHFGARGDSPIFLNHYLNFFDNVFFPCIRERGISKVIHMGDFMDRRKFINFQTLQNVKERFLKPLEELGVETHVIIGNHDIYYKNTSKVNAVSELFEGRENFHIYTDPSQIEIDGTSIDLIPWINRENRDRVRDFINTSKSNICFGHLELYGYYMHPGMKCEAGLDPKEFERYSKVFTGHFHTQSKSKNIHYLGTAYQITFGDWGEEKGFWIFDTDTHELEFIPNPHEIFHKIVYNNGPTRDVDFTALEKCFVKVIVTAKEKPTDFENFLDRLYSSGVEDVTIVEKEDEYEPTEEDVDISIDTITLIENEIDNQEVSNKDDVKKLAREIYLESIDE